MRKLILTGLLAITNYMFATNANAQISYDYIEAGYEIVDIDNLELSDDRLNVSINDFDGGGHVFEGSFSFGRNYFAYADFDFASFDLALGEGNDEVAESFFLNIDPDIDLSTQALGVGYHTDGDRQFVAKVAFLRQEIDSDFWKEATLGYIVELGGRGLFTDNFEWEANIDYTDPDLGDDPSGEVGLNGALRYHFGNNFSTDVSASTMDGDLIYGLNVRYNFSR